MFSIIYLSHTLRLFVYIHVYNGIIFGLCYLYVEYNKLLLFYFFFHFSYRTNYDGTGELL